jgi:hypothetical protein
LLQVATLAAEIFELADAEMWLRFLLPSISFYVGSSLHI